jgi:hypothetical protein
VYNIGEEYGAANDEDRDRGKLISSIIVNTDLPASAGIKLGLLTIWEATSENDAKEIPWECNELIK